MRNQNYTGEHIWSSINKLNDEISRCNKALEELKQGTLAYQVVYDVREGKRKELLQLKRNVYTAYDN